MSTKSDWKELLNGEVVLCDRRDISILVADMEHLGIESLVINNPKDGIYKVNSDKRER